MQAALSSLQDRLAPAEEIFFTWLLRVFAAATLAGSAWIDDAPPLGLAALIIAIYVAVRVAMQFGNLVAAAPFEHRSLKAIFAVGVLVLLVFSFAAVAIFVDRLAVSVASCGSIPTTCEMTVMPAERRADATLTRAGSV